MGKRESGWLWVRKKNGGSVKKVNLLLNFVMERLCKRLIGSKDGKRAIYIDSGNEEEILAYIRQDARHQDKFRYIAAIILEGHRLTSVYDKEEINSKCKGVTAMKFFKGQENDRIYCKEISTPDGVHVVVAAVLHEKKKSNSLSSKELAIITKIGGYSYEIQG